MSPARNGGDDRLVRLYTATQEHWQVIPPCLGHVGQPHDRGCLVGPAAHQTTAIMEQGVLGQSTSRTPGRANPWARSFCLLVQASTETWFRQVPRRERGGRGSLAEPALEYCRRMSELLPLFPLGTVLYPGLLLPLHIFEERYRQLVRDLQAGSQPQRFGVIAIREGRETGVDGISALYEIGCTATVRRVTQHDDGRFDLMTVGTQRFRLAELDQSRPYLQGQVNLLAEDSGDEAPAALAAQAVQVAFRSYLGTLAAQGVAQVSVPDLPAEPVLLSYLVASSMIVDLSDRQVLLAEPDALRRLTAERALLSREIAILRSLSSTPAPDLRNSPYNPN
jgi:uncharacterized protein